MPVPMLSRSPSPPGFIDPYLPTLARTVPDGPLWVHEIKHDGYRFIVRRDGDWVRAFTRRSHDWTGPGAADRGFPSARSGSRR